MELGERDLAVLKLTRTFSQVASTHVSELLFGDRSHSVPDKALGRLVRLGYLSGVGKTGHGQQGRGGGVRLPARPREAPAPGGRWAPLPQRQQPRPHAG